METEHNVLWGSYYKRVYRAACTDWWTAHRKESRLPTHLPPPPAPMRPLCSVLNVWVTRMLPSNVHVQGRACVHNVTVCMCVCVCVSACKRKSGCVWVWRGSVDRNSWKQTCLARNSGMAHNNKFLKMSCDWSRPMAEEGFFGRESRPFFFLFFFWGSRAVNGCREAVVTEPPTVSSLCSVC